MLVVGPQALTRPDCERYETIWSELGYGRALLTSHEIEALADQAHDYAGLPLDHPPPLWLVHRNDLRYAAVVGLPDQEMYCGGLISYRPHADARVEGAAIIHGLAHALLDHPHRQPIPHEHADVHQLALALMCTRAKALRMLRQYGFDGTVRRLPKRNRFAPRDLLRLRLELVVLSVEHA